MATKNLSDREIEQIGNFCSGNIMTPAEQKRAVNILQNLALERKGFWNQCFRRWVISDEPLRHDAANLLRSMGYMIFHEQGQHFVGDDDG